MLIKWQYQPERRANSWEATIRTQRTNSAGRLKKTPRPSRRLLDDPDWWADAWQDARLAAQKETGIKYDVFPETCPWQLSDILDPDWLPS